MSELKYDEPAERFAPIVEKSLCAGATAVMVHSETGCWVHYVEYCEHIANVKSEADKVIAELETKNASLTEEINEWVRSAANRPIIIGRLRQHITVLDNELRHSNYKRCLTMAKWCHNQREIYERDSYNWELERDAVVSLRNKANIMRRWRKRWNELAKEPTWAKFLQLIHKEAK